jgi:hypothetical protein
VSRKRAGLGSSALTLGCILALGLAAAQPSKAGSFTGGYDPSQFTLTNTDNGLFPSFTDGTAMSPDGGLSLVLTGGNGGSGLPGETDFFIAALGTGIVQFHWAYFSSDPFTGFDSAGYLLGAPSSGTTLSSTSGEFGDVTFSVTQGQIFGFFAATADNTGGPGVLTISNFDAPTGVPEPGTATMLLVAGVATAAWRRIKAAPKA